MPGRHTQTVDIALPRVEDWVGEALRFLRMSGMFYCRSEFTSPWALKLPPMNNSLMLHVVTSGECWLEVPGASDQLLRPGSLALVPHGAGHQMASTPGLEGKNLFEIKREPVSDRYERLRLGSGGDASTAICALFQFEHPAALELMKLLPPLIVVTSWNAPHAAWIDSTLRLMAAEAKELLPGGETVITRLADILVIQAIRVWLAQDPAARKGWLGALHDPQIGRILAAIHRDPARAWSVESLAAEAAMSRSAFAARFTELAGEPAMHYVTRWRMYAALTSLRESKSSIGDLSRNLGYDSEAAFSRAFKRHFGFSPGKARQSQNE
jgi:AraC-like DNA-binding protein